ncbi:putative metal-binding protein [Methanophagales archaeon]|nr:putative metal-binding protein [Methanophagales archaeon]
MELDTLLQELGEIHADFRLIPTAEIAVAEWVRWKCEYGCRAYGKHLTCPPYTPRPDETSKLLSCYEQALIVRFRDVHPDMKVPHTHIHHYLWDAILMMHGTMFELERHAFLAGYYKAFAMAALPCSFCRDCLPERENFALDHASKRFCEHQDKARPSMEACGIDVFKTVRAVGYEIDVRTSPEDRITFFGLLLID